MKAFAVFGLSVPCLALLPREAMAQVVSADHIHSTLGEWTVARTNEFCWLTTNLGPDAPIDVGILPQGETTFMMFVRVARLGGINAETAIARVAIGGVVQDFSAHVEGIPDGAVILSYPTTPEFAERFANGLAMTFLLDDENVGEQSLKGSARALWSSQACQKELGITPGGQGVIKFSFGQSAEERKAEIDSLMARVGPIDLSRTGPINAAPRDVQAWSAAIQRDHPSVALRNKQQGTVRMSLNIYHHRLRWQRSSG